MIDLNVYEDSLARTVERARERNIVVPTFAMMKDPSLIADRIKQQLKGIGYCGTMTLELRPWEIKKCLGHVRQLLI